MEKSGSGRLYGVLRDWESWINAWRANGMFKTECTAERSSGGMAWGMLLRDIDGVS